MPPMPNQLQGAKISLGRVSSIDPSNTICPMGLGSNWVDVKITWTVPLLYDSGRLLHKVDRSRAPRNHHLRPSHHLPMEEYVCRYGSLAPSSQIIEPSF